MNFYGIARTFLIRFNDTYLFGLSVYFRTTLILFLMNKVNNLHITHNKAIGVIYAACLADSKSSYPDILSCLDQTKIKVIISS